MQSYFALFELEPRFALAAAQLERAYRAMVARVHPDRHVQAPAPERIQALTLATQVNEAYRTLKKPALRARHLLGLRGLDFHTAKTGLAAEFLMEQMEWRDWLGEALASRNRESLDHLAATVKARGTAILERLETQLDRDQDDRAAMQSVQQQMFIEKLLADLDEARLQLED
jgi:molecular chaperone HscB